MNELYDFSHFLSSFPSNETCLEEIKRYRFPNGIFCQRCNSLTKHYKVKNRTAYVCKSCRTHVYPLSGTIFEKTSTPLRLWFFAMFLMTHTKGSITVKQMQRELGVTYKTAWRMSTSIKKLMALNSGDLLAGTIEMVETEEKSKERKWVFFNTLEFKVVQRQKASK